MLEHERQQQLLSFAAEGTAIRKKQRARKLLRNRAAAFGNAPGAHVSERGTHHRDGIDPGVVAKAMIFDGNYSVAQVQRELAQWKIPAAFFKAEPRPAITRIEDGIGGRLTSQPIDCPSMLTRPYRGASSRNQKNGEQSEQQSSMTRRQTLATTVHHQRRESVDLELPHVSPGRCNSQSTHDGNVQWHNR
jgi:hypothetical protein